MKFKIAIALCVFTYSSQPISAADERAALRSFAYGSIQQYGATLGDQSKHARTQQVGVAAVKPLLSAWELGAEYRQRRTELPVFVNSSAFDPSDLRRFNRLNEANMLNVSAAKIDQFKFSMIAIDAKSHSPRSYDVDESSFELLGSYSFAALTIDAGLKKGIYREKWPEGGLFASNQWFERDMIGRSVRLKYEADDKPYSIEIAHQTSEVIGTLEGRDIDLIFGTATITSTDRPEWSSTNIFANYQFHNGMGVFAQWGEQISKNGDESHRVTTTKIGTDYDLTSIAPLKNAKVSFSVAQRAGDVENLFDRFGFAADDKVSLETVYALGVVFQLGGEKRNKVQWVHRQAAALPLTWRNISCLPAFAAQ